jgi:hypothetical protein
MTIRDDPVERSKMSDDQISFIDGTGGERGNRFDTKTAVLPNGVKISRLNSASPIAIFNFLYEDKEFSFRFLASRWGDDARPSDTWRVNLGMRQLRRSAL